MHSLSKECVDYAHKNNVQVRNALLNVQVQNQTNRDITAAALPTVTGTISAETII
jgi:outer membrane protein